MATILELQHLRESLYKSLVFLKDEIQDYIKNPVETVSIDNLQNQYSFILRQINTIDFQVKNILLIQIQHAKLDLKNLETQLTMLPRPFHVDDLPPYSQIFK